MAVEALQFVWKQDDGGEGEGDREHGIKDKTQRRRIGDVTRKIRDVLVVNRDVKWVS